MSEEFQKNLSELNKFNNKLLSDLDISMCKKVSRIRTNYAPSKSDLEALLSLYQMTMDTYKKNNVLYNLNSLKYTDLTEVRNILSRYGYLKSEKIDISNSDDERIIDNRISTYQTPVISGNQSDNVLQDANGSIIAQDISEEKEDIFVEQKNPFNSNGPVYAFSNEALNQYMKNYDFKGKSVLASLGSGDFALNAYLLGASEVETFDINKYTYYFYQLKKALIIKYDYESFCNLIKNPQEIFKKFNEYKQFLDSDSISFFERLLKLYNNNIIGLLKKVFIDKVGEQKNQWNESNTFDTLEELFLIAQYKNYYLQSVENYNKLKQQLAMHYNDEFYFANLYEFTPPKKYDIVYLSNIGDYSKSEEEFNDFVMNLREKLLNENGIIIVVSITNHIYMDSDSSERTMMNFDDMREFDRINAGKASLPICNLGGQNVYTTYPYQSKLYR